MTKARGFGGHHGVADPVVTMSQKSRNGGGDYGNGRRSNFGWSSNFGFGGVIEGCRRGCGSSCGRRSPQVCGCTAAPLAACFVCQDP